jgi:hypothetical protein
VSAVPAADPRSQEDILAEELAALPDVPPPGEDDWPDPEDDTGCPAGYAHLTFPEIDELLAAQPAPVPEVWPARRDDLDQPGRPPLHHPPEQAPHVSVCRQQLLGVTRREDAASLLTIMSGTETPEG